MHQSLYCLAASIASVFIASMSDYQSQTPKDKCCCCYDWPQQILIFKYHWYYPPHNGFPDSFSFKKSPAHLYLTRQLSCPSSPNAAALCSEAPPGHWVWYQADGSCELQVLPWCAPRTATAVPQKGKKLPSPTTRSVRPCNPLLLHGSSEGQQGWCPLC